MKVIIKMVSGTSFTVEGMEPTDSVRELKGRLYEKEGFLPEAQRLGIAQAKASPLDDLKSLSDYDIQNESVVYLVVAHKETEGASATSAEPEWQLNKTQEEKLRYILENGEESDVLIEAKDAKGNWKVFEVHRCFLTLASPVLQRLAKRLPGRPYTRVKIEEVTSDILWLMLQFIYYGALDLSMCSVIPLLRAARLYKVSDMEAKCRKYIKQQLYKCSWSESLTLYNQAVQQGWSDIASQQMRRIEINMQQNHKLPEFTQLSRPALAQLLQSDKLVGCSEVELYQASLRWARARCAAEGQEATDAACREALGECLYLIRFPTMTTGEFTEITDGCSILTDQEQLKMYRYLASNIKSMITLPFATGYRLQQVARFPQQGADVQRWRCCGRPDAIAFRTDAPIELTHVYVYHRREAGRKHKAGRKRYVHIEVLDEEGAVLAEADDSVTSTGGYAYCSLPLTKPLRAEPNRTYTVTQSTKPTRLAQYGVNGRQTVTAGGVTLTFVDSERDKNETSIQQGQIYGLVFYPRN